MFAHSRHSLVALAVLLMSVTSAVSFAVVSRHADAGINMDAIQVREVIGSNTTDVGPTLDARSPAAIAKLAIDGITSIITAIQDGINADKQARGQFTSNLVTQMRKKHPNFNWVVCHTKHEVKFEGDRGKQWSHRHQEFDIKIGGTIGYEIYNFKAGTFIRKGDGGYLNWAYSGRVTNKSQDGKTITFAAP